MSSPTAFPRILPTLFWYWKQAARTTDSISNLMILILISEHRNANVLDVIVPFLGPQATPDTPQDWNYTTTPQAGLGGRSIAYPRGFILGGSSSVSKILHLCLLIFPRIIDLISDFMVYTRGSKEDFDRWAKVTGDNGWSWDNLVPYMKKVLFHSATSPQISYTEFRMNVSAHLQITTTPPDSSTLPSMALTASTVYPLRVSLLRQTHGS